MSFADWHSGVSVATTASQHGFINMSTVDDLSYTPSEDEKYRDAAQIAATGRRSWKTLRGKGEAVWPPNLSGGCSDRRQATLQIGFTETLTNAVALALEKYRQEGTWPNKLLDRFPMRNRFISDYIFEVTGKCRTTKQVSSRLQQMRDTCKGGPIMSVLELISGRFSSVEAETMTESSGTVSEGSCHASQMPYENSSSRDHLCVEISVQPSMSPVPIIHFNLNDIATPLVICLASSAVPAYQGHSVSRNSRGSVLHTSSNTVEFTSPWALILSSVFYVYCDGSELLVHTEDVPLKCLSSPVQSSGWLYSTEITPAFWKTLCEKKELTRYMILQRLTPIQSYQSPNVARRSSAPAELARSSQEIFVVYHFDVVDELDVKVLDTTFNYQSTSSQSNVRIFLLLFVAPSQQHPSMDYHQWDSSREHTANWLSHQTQPVDQHYSSSMTTAPPYTQNNYAYDRHYTHISTDSSFKYGGSQYETGYGVPGISSWPNQHAEVPSLHYAYL
ncbi:uncharacterized protein LACBIDRAFT_333124 [Laccaria bicolor S238N-H82]|uniref:Predicted protein n=1 Tax=Laccaria bicolor (strain S238N-H82 / ATCC MYA-4686) TaxID=486041 RepID=B0DUY9_LACBS|nr:uncharacterized protein LACBIDRAFT_333124 [Laccaria bicolor S238N-H82]EDR01694.1 predicted protein [Laccaria bicolor S238N-H82]|eukprot:XP_001887770.1 predicted protein [Laccaria bicolor S238N-H82]